MTYIKPPVSSPWGGVNDSLPPTSLQMSEFSSVANWLLRKGRIQTPPVMSPFLAPPNGEPVMGAKYFQDVLGNYHNLVLTQDTVYFINGDAYPPTYNLVGPVMANRSNNPWAIEYFLNSLFFANGEQDLSYVDGSANWAVAGDVNATCKYLGKLAAHLVMAYTIEPFPGGTGVLAYPRRVRWSGSGNPMEWNSSVDFSSGYTDLPDIEDEITGFNVLNTYGFVYRGGGITVMTATGTGTSPFTFEPFSIGPEGIGVDIPETLATYGMWCVFKAKDDIYLFDGSSPQRIGTKAKASIFADLEARVDNPRSTIISSLTKGYDFLSYWLAIPLDSDVCRLWIFNYDEGSWTSFTLGGSLGMLTFMGELKIPVS